MEYEIRKLGVDIKLNTAPTIEELKELNPYAIFVAIGGKKTLHLQMLKQMEVKYYMQQIYLKEKWI